MTRWPPWRTIKRPTRGETRPAASSASETPPMAKPSDQPRSSATSGPDKRIAAEDFESAETDRSALDCLKAPDQYACIAHIIGRQLRPDERSLDAVAFPRRQRYRDEAAARHDSIPLHRGGRHHASLELHRPRLDRIGSAAAAAISARSERSPAPRAGRNAQRYRSRSVHRPRDRRI